MRSLTRIFVIVTASLPMFGQQPSPTPAIREEVLVTTDRIETRIGDTPASVVSISTSDIRTTASPVMDDVLRRSVGFSIFRRSSSRHANPTTQGVSLRGVGSSGASRSVVLFDGIPLNDPFGGWIQWNRVVPVAVENVEVLRGGASSLYGNSGLSGAVNIKPRNIDKKRVFSADVFGGTQHTVSGAVFAGLTAAGWNSDISASSFQTKGYRPVDEPVRGPVDGFAGVRSSILAGTLGREIGRNASIFFRPSYFGEVRTNGTAAQTNRTHIRNVTGGGEIILIPSRSLKLNWRAYAGTQVFDQVFSAINAARTAESVTRVQRSPARHIGFSGQGSITTGSHVLLGGADFRNVRGSSDELAFASGLPTAFVDAGGREGSVGIFFQDVVRIGHKVIVSARLRYDQWQNYAGYSASRPITAGQPAVTEFPDRTEDAWSPHIAVLVNVTGNVSIYGSASRSFRSPTLNELYRGFRVGNVVTLANELLAAERAVNLESGASYSRSRFSLRANAFRTTINDAVGNITLSTTPSLITRQRKNAGQTRSVGAEVEGELRLRSIDVSAGYLYVRSTVADFPSNPSLVGLWVPQVPRHQFTAQMLYSRKLWTVAAQGRASGTQFDDDLNTLRLERFAQVDVFLSRNLREDLTIYAGVENIFNSRYSIGRTPIRTVSSPVNLRVGLKWR